MRFPIKSRRTWLVEHLQNSWEPKSIIQVFLWHFGLLPLDCFWFRCDSWSKTMLEWLLPCCWLYFFSVIISFSNLFSHNIGARFVGGDVGGYYLCFRCMWRKFYKFPIHGVYAPQNLLLLKLDADGALCFRGTKSVPPIFFLFRCILIVLIELFSSQSGLSDSLLDFHWYQC